MNTKSLKNRIKNGLFLLDGAMGTQLFAHGIEAGKCNDYLNIEAPDLVVNIHKAYLAAGADAVITNTFGANKFALARHGLGEKVKQINTAAAKLARKAAGSENYVLGDIGPSGDFLEPLGTLKADELKEAFAKQANSLLVGGVDGFIIETITAIEEMTIAIEALKSISGDLPVFASMAFDSTATKFRTMMGLNVETAVSTIAALGADAVGFNCGSATLDEYVALAADYVKQVKKTEKNLPLFAEPNAGKPELVDGKAVYKVSPDEFAQAARKIHSLGINIIGGCCGTGPEHIKAAARQLKGK